MKRAKKVAKEVKKQLKITEKLKSARKIDICDKWEKIQKKCGKIAKKRFFSRKKVKKLIKIEAKRYRERRTDDVVNRRTKKKKKDFRQTTDRRKRTRGTRLMQKIS